MPARKSEYNYVRKTFHYDGLKYEVCGRTEEEAIEKKLEKLRQLKEGRLDSSITVKRWANLWYETYVEPRDITEKSKSMYRGYLDRIIIPELGSIKLSKVSDIRLQQLLNSRAGGSSSDVGKLRLVLRALFRQASQSRIIPFDPAAGLKLPKVTTGAHRSLTDEERRALIAVANYPAFDGNPNRSGCWLMLMLRCGLRPGETAALRKRCVDLKRKVITVVEAKESGSSDVKDPKTAAGMRTVPIPDDLLPWLEKQMVVNDSPLLFTQKDGCSMLSESSMRRRWETVKKYMDLELGAKWKKIKPPGQRRHSLLITESVIADDLDLYDLRHTYCTDLQKAGVPLNIAKVLMGHKDIAVTANIYTHADDASIEAARILINGGEKAPGGNPGGKSETRSRSSASAQAVPALRTFVS